MSLNALYVDFNSYFASVEQLLRPELRGRPIAVLPVVAETTCCIAASNEAKKFGVKTGTRVSDARKMCPGIVLVEARHALYVEYHHKLVSVVESCTHVEKTFSIDEMVCRLTGSQRIRENALALAQRIKRRIAEEVGPEILCSIGIAPNTYLAKVASDMQKPDGCVVIEMQDLPHKLFGLKLRDLNGIGKRMEERLMRKGIRTVQALYALNRQQLRAAWGSIDGERMYDKLRGIETGHHRDGRSSLGHSHILPPEMRTQDAAKSVLHRLLQKACLRLRSHGLLTGRLHMRVKFLGHPTWQTECRLSPTDSTQKLTHALDRLCEQFPSGSEYTPYAVGITFLDLTEPSACIDDLFERTTDAPRSRLDAVLDQLNMRYGKNTVYFGGAHSALNYAPMRIAFNHIPDPGTEGD
ncbi:MAG TPA: DNA polymerase [Methylophilaceae bacterium]